MDRTVQYCTSVSVHLLDAERWECHVAGQQRAALAKPRPTYVPIMLSTSDEPPPPWLNRVTAAGGANAAAADFADTAGVSVAQKTDEFWVAQCVALELAIFPAHEAMDIAHEIYRTRGVTLLCATPIQEWSGPQFGGTFGPGKCVGYAVLQRNDVSTLGNNAFASLEPPTVLISKLAVAPLFQRRGIGKSLLAAAVGRARAMRARACRLHVDEANTRARALYTSMGWAPVGERLVDFYRAGRHAILMELDLDLVDQERGASAEAGREDEEDVDVDDESAKRMKMSHDRVQQAAITDNRALELIEELD